MSSSAIEEEQALPSRLKEGEWTGDREVVLLGEKLDPALMQLMKENYSRIGSGSCYEVLQEMLAHSRSNQNGGSGSRNKKYASRNIDDDASTTPSGEPGTNQEDSIIWLLFDGAVGMRSYGHHREAEEAALRLLEIMTARCKKDDFDYQGRLFSLVDTLLYNWPHNGVGKLDSSTTNRDQLGDKMSCEEEAFVRILNAALSWAKKVSVFVNFHGAIDPEISNHTTTYVKPSFLRSYNNYGCRALHLLAAKYFLESRSIKKWQFMATWSYHFVRAGPEAIEQFTKQIINVLRKTAIQSEEHDLIICREVLKVLSLGLLDEALQLFRTVTLAYRKTFEVDRMYNTIESPDRRATDFAISLRNDPSSAATEEDDRTEPT